MARRTSLSPEQITQAQARHASGETITALAKAFRVGTTVMHRYVSGNQTGSGKSNGKRILEVATQLADAQDALCALPILHQHSAVSLAEKLRNMSTSLASAGELGAKTAHRLNSLANTAVSRVDDADPMASIKDLRDVGVLTKLANDSASIALNLLAANKGSMSEAERQSNASAAELTDDQLATVLAGPGGR